MDHKGATHMDFSPFIILIVSRWSPTLETVMQGIKIT